MLRSRQSLLALRAPARLGLAFLAFAAFLSGCGFVKYEQREAWRGEAEIACMKSGIVKPSEFVRITKPIDGAGVCGLDIPLKVQALQNDQSVIRSFAEAGVPQMAAAGANLQLTVLKPEATLTCPMVAWLDDWLATEIQPAALAWFGQGVKEIRSGGTYACRRRNHQPGARLSEHAFGNAIDIMSFVLTDGTVITVKGGWRGTPNEQGFLRDVLHSACGKFRTVLGPGSDAFHYDHFHVDLARHDTKGQRRYCRPRLEAQRRPTAPQFNPQLSMPPATAFNNSQPVQPSGPPVTLSQRGPQPFAPPAGIGGGGMTLDQQASRLSGEPMEQEEDFDPRAFDLTSSVPELPMPRNLRPDRRQPLPESSTGILTERRAPLPRSQPSQKILMPPNGN